MTEDEAKRIIFSYRKGQCGLHDFVEAVTVYANSHPNATVKDMDEWASEVTQNAKSINKESFR